MPTTVIPVSHGVYWKTGVPNKTLRSREPWTQGDRSTHRPESQKGSRAKSLPPGRAHAAPRRRGSSSQSSPQTDVRSEERTPTVRERGIASAESPPIGRAHSTPGLLARRPFAGNARLFRVICRGSPGKREAHLRKRVGRMANLPPDDPGRNVRGARLVGGGKPVASTGSMSQVCIFHNNRLMPGIQFL